LNPISPLLIAYRKHHNQTQKDLVTELSQYSKEFRALNTVTLSRWETGTTSPSLSKKKLLLNFFANTQCLTSDDTCHDIIYEAYEKLYEPLSTVFTRKYQYLIGNLPEHRTGKHIIEDLKHFSQKKEHIDHIIDIEIATNATNYYSITPSILTEWCAMPSTFCIVDERKKQHLGHFIMLKLKNHVAEEIAHHKKSEFDLKKNDFCDIYENGTYYVHALYGRSPKIAAELNVKAYLHLLDHMNTVDNVMIFSSRTDGVLLTQDYGIKEVAHGVDQEFDFKWHGMLSPMKDILFSDIVVKLIF
jgi:transcriptional regulator with XRE-family HTH domain